MLGAGIGMATLDPASADNPAASTFSISAAVWWVISGIIAAFAGGYVAARMSGRTVPSTGAFHGLTTWAFTTLLVLYLLTTTAGSLVGGVFSGVASAIGGVGQTVAQSAAPMLANGNPLDAIERQVRATGTDPEALNNAAVNAIRQLLTGDAANADQARQQAAQALAQARNIPLEEARQQVTAFEQQYQQTVDQAEQAATRSRGHRRLGDLDRRAGGLRRARVGRDRRLVRRPLGRCASGIRRRRDATPPAGLSPDPDRR